jgi:tRNA dimethylallyltransferase
MAAQPERLVAIVGETASGKSALAIELAQRFDGEIICADSRTIYKKMDIGTAKPTDAERQLVPHHMLDVITPDRKFSAVQFKVMASDLMKDISGRGKLPIMVGGTGLYIDSVLFDYQFPETQRDAVNPRHANSEQRDREHMRANTLVIGLRVPREVLEARITARVEAMIQAGLPAEIESLAEEYGWEAPGMQAPAYRAFRPYAEVRLSLDKAKAEFVKNDLNLAKRQRTWFKRNESIQWVDDPRQAVDLLTTYLNKRQ